MDIIPPSPFVSSRVEYTTAPTDPPYVPPVIVVEPEIPYDVTKDAAVQAALASPQHIWVQKLADGYLDEKTGIRIKTTDGSVDPNDNAQGWFAKMIALITLALQGGAITTATPMSIWDYDGKEHSMPVGELVGLLLRYGMYCQSIFVKFKP